LLQFGETPLAKAGSAGPVSEMLRAHGARLHSVLSAAKEDLVDELSALIAQGADPEVIVTIARANSK